MELPFLRVPNKQWDRQSKSEYDWLKVYNGLYGTEEVADDDDDEFDEEISTPPNPLTSSEEIVVSSSNDILNYNNDDLEFNNWIETRRQDISSTTTRAIKFSTTSSTLKSVAKGLGHRHTRLHKNRAVTWYENKIDQRVHKMEEELQKNYQLKLENDSISNFKKKQAIDGMEFMRNVKQIDHNRHVATEQARQREYSQVDALTLLTEKWSQESEHKRNKNEKQKREDLVSCKMKHDIIRANISRQEKEEDDKNELKSEIDETQEVLRMMRRYGTISAVNPPQPKLTDDPSDTSSHLQLSFNPDSRRLDPSDLSQFRLVTSLKANQLSCNGCFEFSRQLLKGYLNRLVILNLNDCAIGNYGFECICNVLRGGTNRELRKLLLKRNNISNISPLESAKGQLSSLDHLDLSGNLITDRDAFLLSSLMTHKQLTPRMLNLQFNKISKIGVDNFLLIMSSSSSPSGVIIDLRNNEYTTIHGLVLVNVLI